MAFLLSRQSADWLRAQMSAGNTRTRKRDRNQNASAPDVAHPWKISTAPGDAEGELAVSVSAGPVAWGGGFNAVWPGGEVGTVGDGETRLVVWLTKQAAVPLAHDPRWPDGDAPKCACEDCDCMERKGNPEAGEASAGSVELAEEPFARPEGVTDWRIVGRVSNSGGVPSIEQSLWSEITVRAILRADEEPGEDPDPEEGVEAPPCGHPMNGGGGGEEENPLDEEEGGGGTDPTPEEGRDENPLDSPGDGGFTPVCNENPQEEI